MGPEDNSVEDLLDMMKKAMAGPPKVPKIRRVSIGGPNPYDDDGMADWSMDDDGLIQIEEAEDEPYDEPEMTQIAARLAEALDNGESIDWMLIKGDRISKKAARWWLERKARIAKIAEGKRLAKEKKDREAQVMKDILAKLSDEEKALLKIKGKLK